MLNNELQPLRKAALTKRVPYSNRPGEPWRALREAIDAWHAWLHQRRSQLTPDLVALMVTACVAAAEAGSPFATHGPRGVYERRVNLPHPLSGETRRRLHASIRKAIAGGLLVRGTGAQRGDLLAP
jgi:hypothetical protein